MLVLGAATSLDDALLAMQRDRLHVAVVTDDEGRTMGIATLEDVIEALVGDIRDESDRDGRRGPGFVTEMQQPSRRRYPRAAP